MKKMIAIFIGIMLVMPLYAEKKESADNPVQEKLSGAKGTDNAKDVVIEEYVPEVIIEGKWGAGEGEFGKTGWPTGESHSDSCKPSSLAVDSKGNIYILDVVNNRIQKFAKNGKYIESIPVESFKGEVWGYDVRLSDGKDEMITTYEKDDYERYYERKGKDLKVCEILRERIRPTKVQGINIVIDSEDNLYYYCIRKDEGQETGEVWKIAGDKVVERWEVPAGGRGHHGTVPLRLDEDDSIWVVNINDPQNRWLYEREHEVKYYELKEKKVYTTKQRDEKLKKAKEKYKGQKVKRVSPLTRLRQYDLKITSEGLKVIKEK